MLLDPSNGLPDGFDSRSYLLLNPDVAKARVDPVKHWTEFGNNENRRYRFEGRQFRLAALTMIKNEGPLLAAWAKYHSKLLGGYENLFVFDNGSEDDETRTTLSELEEQGARVDRRFNGQEHFARKGDIIANKIRELDLLEPFDFYFPLDCDELLAVEIDSRLSVHPKELNLALEAIEQSPAPFLVSSQHLAHPENMAYLRRTEHRKVFFGTNSVQSLDLGFHRGTSIHGREPTSSNCTYLHFHNLSYTETLRRARQKLATRVNVDDEIQMVRHYVTRGAGWHLVKYFFQSETDYYSQYKLDEYSENVEVSQSLRAMGVLPLIERLLSSS